ncbi:hypothetical protein PM082_016638 [Marasmius tenuissimus]|nr:hypothetical protein PM082_016638 [Marasmius tenuissimus]
MLFGPMRSGQRSPFGDHTGLHPPQMPQQPGLSPMVPVPLNTNSQDRNMLENQNPTTTVGTSAPSNQRTFVNFPNSNSFWATSGPTIPSQQFNFTHQNTNTLFGPQPDLQHIGGGFQSRQLPVAFMSNFSGLTRAEFDEIEADPDASGSDADEGDGLDHSAIAEADMLTTTVRTSIGGTEIGFPHSNLPPAGGSTGTVNFQFPTASPAMPQQPQHTNTQDTSVTHHASDSPRPLMLTPAAQALGVPRPPNGPMSGPDLYSALGAGMDDEDELDADLNGDGNEDADVAVSPTKKRRRGFTAMNLSGLHHSIATMASHIYTVRTVTGSPFPMQIRDVNTPTNPRDTLAASSWCEAMLLVCGQNQIVDGTSPVPSLGEINEIKKRDTAGRSRFKMAARAKVQAQYGFLTTIEAETDVEWMSENNHSLVEKLKAEDSFVFQDPFSIDTPGTIYRNRVIKDTILEALYNNRDKSLGVILQYIIGEAMPLPVIALADEPA